jgi:hypothetical protein
VVERNNPLWLPRRRQEDNKLIFKEENVRMLIGFIRLRTANRDGTFKHGNELSHSVKSGEFLD